MFEVDVKNMMEEKKNKEKKKEEGKLRFFSWINEDKPKQIIIACKMCLHYKLIFGTEDCFGKTNCLCGKSKF